MKRSGLATLGISLSLTQKSPAPEEGEGSAVETGTISIAMVRSGTATVEYSDTSKADLTLTILLGRADNVVWILIPGPDVLARQTATGTWQLGQMPNELDPHVWFSDVKRLGADPPDEADYTFNAATQKWEYSYYGEVRAKETEVFRDPIAAIRTDYTGQTNTEMGSAFELGTDYLPLEEP